MMLEQELALRNEALQAALRLPGACDAETVLKDAQRIYAWLKAGKADG
jgi:hypothetical protein